MSVLNMIAHTLSYKEDTGGYQDEETGDYVKGSSRWVEDYCKCDIVPAGKANVIKLEDGTTDTYSYTIRNLPLSCREFKYGDKIRIKLYGATEEKSEYIEREFTVLGFHRYQLQCKMWV